MSTEYFQKEIYDQIVHYFNRRLSRTDIVEDLTQEVFLKAVGKLSTLKSKKAFRQWLYRISFNTLVDYYRRNHKQKKIFLHELVLASPVKSTKDHAMSEVALCLKPIIDSLPNRYREVLLLSEFEGIKHRDIAKRLKLSIPGVKSLVYRGRKMIKNKIEQCCKIELDQRKHIIGFEKHA